MHHVGDRLRRDVTAAAAEGRDEDAGDVFREGEHETGAHAGVDDHRVFDAGRDSHGGGVDELDVAGVDEDAGADGLLATEVFEEVGLNPGHEVAAKPFGYGEVVAAVHETVGVGGGDDAVDFVGLHEVVEAAVEDGEVRVFGKVLGPGVDGIDVLVDEIDMHGVTSRNVFEDYNKRDGAELVQDFTHFYLIRFRFI